MKDDKSRYWAMALWPDIEVNLYWKTLTAMSAPVAITQKSVFTISLASYHTPLLIIVCTLFQ